MLYIGSRGTAGAGTAIVTAGASERIRVYGHFFLQIAETGDVTVIPKFVVGEDSSKVHVDIILGSSDTTGVLLDLPMQVSPLGASLHLDLSDAIDVNYTIQADVI